MSTGIAEAFIITGGVVIAQVGIAWRTNSVIKLQIETLKEQLTKLEKKQDKHNGLIERMKAAEIQICHLEEHAK